IVARDVLEEPFDGVVRVCAFVNFLGCLRWTMRPYMLELSLRHPASTHVLVSKNITLPCNQRRRAQILCVAVRAVGCHAIGCSLQKNGVRCGLILGNVKSREQTDTVPHGYRMFLLGIIGLNVFESLRKTVAVEDQYE